MQFQAGHLGDIPACHFSGRHRRNSRVVVVIERCNESHNYSAVLRTAEALGYHHVWVVAPPTLDIDAALAKGRALDLKPLSVVVLDPRAAMVAMMSEDGVSQMRARIAHGKANAAIALGMGTRALMNRAEQQAYFIQAVNGVAGGDMVPVPGGVLIQDQEGALLGAVGISGDTSDNDEAAAIAGIEAAGLNAVTG